MSKAKKTEALVTERNKLMSEYAANKRVRIKLRCDLDRLTARIAQLAGLQEAGIICGRWLA